MKSPDLESKAKQSAPPYCHPPESPVVSLSDLLSKWPQDRERFQVILDLNTETYVTIFTFCKWLVLRTISEIVSSCKIKHTSNKLFLPFSHPSALESGSSSGIFGALSSPIGVTRRNISYDELMEAPLHSPPADMTVNILWKDPIIPQHKFRNTAEVHSCLFLLSDPNCFEVVPWTKCCLYWLVPGAKVHACVHLICLPVRYVTGLCGNSKCKLVWLGKWEWWEVADFWGTGVSHVPSACCESQSHIFNELTYDQ